MPGRSSSTRASSAASTRKSSVPPSAPTVYIPEEPALPTTSASLRSNVVEIFADAQRAITGHRKLAIKLRKIQEVCCGLRVAKVDGKKGSRLSEIPDLAGGGLPEKELNIEICRCLIRVVPVKKAEGAADRVIKFLGTFLKAATDKGKCINLLTELNKLSKEIDLTAQILRFIPTMILMRRAGYQRPLLRGLHSRLCPHSSHYLPPRIRRLDTGRPRSSRT